MTLSYEDESGNISTTTKDLNLEVTEKVDDDEAAASDMPEETQKSFPCNSGCNRSSGHCSGGSSRNT